MKAVFVTLGCKVNQYESEAMLSQLCKAGFTPCPKGEPADVVILNSCTVTAASDQKVRQTLHKARREHPDAVIVLTGCMPQAFPEESAELSDADIVLGNSNRSSLLSHIMTYLSTHQRIIDIVPHEKKESFEPLEITSIPENSRRLQPLLLLLHHPLCQRSCALQATGGFAPRSPSLIQPRIPRSSLDRYQSVLLRTRFGTAPVRCSRGSLCR